MPTVRLTALALLSLAFLFDSSPARAVVSFLNDDDSKAHAGAAKDFEDAANGNAAFSMSRGRRKEKPAAKPLQEKKGEDKKETSSKTATTAPSAPLSVAPGVPAPAASGGFLDDGDKKNPGFWLWMGAWIAIGAFGVASVLTGGAFVTMLAISLGAGLGAVVGYESKAFVDPSSY